MRTISQANLIKTNEPRPLILASISPRRAELLREAGYLFEIIPPSIDEPATQSRKLTPVRVAESISYFKAKSVRSSDRHAVILAADTIVALGREIFGKPAHRADARRILTALSGTTHQTITGVTVLAPHATPSRLISHEVSNVRMRAWSEEELICYLDSGKWQGKAGAYGIQDEGDPFVECIEGSLTNVVGLPMELVTQMLARFNVMPLNGSRLV